MVANWGCASLPKDSKYVQKVNIQNNLEVLNGDFYVDISNSNYGEINRIIEIINRNSSKWPDIELDKKYKLTIRVLDKEKVNIGLWKNENLLIEKSIKFKEKDNYICLKNNNIKLHNIPFILGGYDLMRARLALTDKGDLIIDTVRYGIGSLLFVIWSGSPKMQSFNIYYKPK